MAGVKKTLVINTNDETKSAATNTQIGVDLTHTIIVGPRWITDLANMAGKVFCPRNVYDRGIVPQIEALVDPTGSWSTVQWTPP
jgi:hypothetical protein